MSVTLGTTTTPTRRFKAGLLHRLLRNPLGLAALVIIALVTVIGVLGPLIAPFDPNQAALGNALQPPGGEHLLGTDSAGRDILSRLLVGARVTLLAAALAASVAGVIGLLSGLIAGYFGGWFDSASTWAANVLMSLPGMIVLLAVSAALGTSVWVSMTVLGVLMSASVFRLTRTTVRAVRGELYVDAARVSGVGDVSILGRHILFVVRAPLIIQLSVIAGISIALQASLDFLGITEPTTVSWGRMLFEAFAAIYSTPLLTVWPAVAITVTIGAFVLLGNALRDALEDAPRVRLRRTPRDRQESEASMQSASAPPEADGSVLRISDLGISYPTGGGTTRVVHDVSLHVMPGEILGIVGESGSGKTQTAFATLGLLDAQARIDSGSIRFGERILVGPRGATAQSRYSGIRGREIAYIPQEPMSNLDPNYTIGHQLIRPIVALLGVSRTEARGRAVELLGVVGIRDPEKVMKRYPHEISGGMAQRVLIAGAVACGPKLLIADEPTTALDVTVQAEVLDLIRRLRDTSDMAVIMVTHNFGVVADLADRVAVMQTGRIVETGDVRQILTSPAHPYTRSLLDAMLADRDAPSKSPDLAVEETA